jgi:lambda repressor-like predicted transcriptional regulator
MSKPVSARDVPLKPYHRRAWANYQLRLAGSNLTALARAAGVSEPAISNCFDAPNSHLEGVIAEKIGLTARELFPERFDDDGNRLSPVRRQTRSTRPHARERSKSGRH